MTRPGRSRGRVLLTIAWPSALVVGLFLRIAPYGYNPTDDGNLLAQTYRILHGQVPHKDIIFARPMGSALLHVIDYGLPLSLFKASRLTGITEIVVYSLLLGVLILGKPPTRWTTPEIALVIASTFLNLHTFPLMAWYTTDGLLFTTIGLVVLSRRGTSQRRWLTLVGLLALGLAPVMKQSFFAAPVVGLIIIAWTSRKSSLQVALRRSILAAAALALPFLVYAVVIASLGGLSAMVLQLTHVHDIGSVFSNAIFNFSRDPHTVGPTLVFLILTISLRVGEVSADGDGRWSTMARRCDLPLRVVMTTALVVIPIADRFGYYQGWSIALFWALVFLTVSAVISKRQIRISNVLVILVAWMVSLSWGYGLPGLVAGSLALAALCSIWSATPSPVKSLRATSPMVAGLSLVLLFALTLTFVNARDNAPYFDRARPDLTASLDSVSAAFRGIRTNPVTAGYLSQAAACIAHHPAKWVAVLPDNPGIYPALHLRNPFPIDWMLKDEVQGEESRILSATDRINARGSFLVLFQTYSAFDLAFRTNVGIAKITDQPFFGGISLGHEIAERLQGQKILCGPFTGIYRPD